MPTSDAEGKQWSQELIIQHAPLKIVDVGCGDGTYARLLRECGWEGVLYGVEIWDPYVAEYGLSSLYDELMVADIRDIGWPSLPERGQMIIFGDVLEHMPKADALEVLEKAQEYFGYILVSLPIVHSPQGEVNGNPYEAHLHQWEFWEMLSVTDWEAAYEGNTLGVFFWVHEDRRG